MHGTLSNLGLLKAAAKSYLGKDLTAMEEFYVDMYASEIATMLSRGRLLPLDSLSYDEVQIANSFIGTLSTKHKVYCVSKFSTEFSTNITHELKEAINAIYPEVDLIVQKSSFPFFYKTNTRQFIAAHANAVRNHEATSTFFKKLTPSEQTRGVRIGSKVVNAGFVKTFEQDRMSYDYVKGLSKNNRFTLTYLLIHVIMPDKIERADDYKDEDPEDTIASLIRDFAVESNCIIKEVRDLRDYISSLSPIGWLHPKKLFSSINANLFGPPNFSAHMDYTQGVEGQSGIDYGTVLNTNSPLCINTKSSAFAQVFLVTGKTGFGKTTIMKAALEQHLLMEDYCDVCDFKGSDYSGLMALYPNLVKRIDMDAGAYPNLFDLTGYPCPTDTTIVLAIENIVDSLITMMDLQGNEVDTHIKNVESLLTILVKGYFTTKGVMSDINTFNKSVNCNYFEFWGIASKTMNESSTIRENYKDQIHLVKTRLQEYFTPDGAKADYLKRPINLKEYIDARCVIYAFNMMNRDDSADVRTQLSYLFQNAISGIRNVKIVSEKKAQVLTIEEFQVASNAIGMLRSVARRASVSRSSNVILYILLNDINIFRTETREGRLLVSKEEDKALGTIKACFTSFFVGYMEHDNAVKFNELFKLKEIEKDILVINEAESDGDDRYNFAFKYDSGDERGYGTMRLKLPKTYMDPVLYGTRKIDDANAVKPATR